MRGGEAEGVGRPRRWLRRGLAGLLVIGGLVGLIALMSRAPEGMEVGARAPEYRAPMLRGSWTSLSQYRGEVVLVNIWATWCEPCRGEMPSIEDLYTRYRDRGFTVLGVSIDAGPGSKDRVSEFVSDLGVDFPILLDPDSRITRLLKTSGVPETLVIDRQGRIVKRVIGASDWSSAANRALIEDLVEG